MAQALFYCHNRQPGDEAIYADYLRDELPGASVQSQFASSATAAPLGVVTIGRSRYRITALKNPANTLQRYPSALRHQNLRSPGGDRKSV